MSRFHNMRLDQAKRLMRDGRFGEKRRKRIDRLLLQAFHGNRTMARMTFTTLSLSVSSRRIVAGMSRMAGAFDNLSAYMRKRNFVSLDKLMPGPEIDFDIGRAYSGCCQPAPDTKKAGRALARLPCS